MADQANRKGNEEEGASKKVNPYPFEIEIAAGEGKPAVKCHVHKMTYTGFLMRVQGTHHFKVGQDHVARFLIPGVRLTVEELVKVIKTYDALHVQTGNSMVKIYTIEMHFRELKDSTEEALKQFFKSIGQK